MLMVKRFDTQRGAALIEVALSASVAALVMVGTISFATRALKTLRHISKARAPGCERPTCAADANYSTCSCGGETAIVIW